MSDRCQHCQTQLAGKSFMVRERRNYCSECFNKLFSHPCDGCNQTIGPGSRELSFGGKHFHDKCFCCGGCNTPLENKAVDSSGPKLLCRGCATGSANPDTCHSCKRAIRPGSKKVNYKGKSWHENCFTCDRCMDTIGSQSFVPVGDEIFCVSCHQKKSSSRCFGCHKPIGEGGVVFQEHSYHRDCIVCTSCEKKLGHSKFETRGELIYCQECFNRKYAKKCAFCSQAIGAGSEYVTHDGKQWHTECFRCKRCRARLAGKSFVNKGEDLICADCAKK
uniref:four and a half LIM domains protein 2-like n=1 Tax=Myxine glutinosa TaxID=7769 RepID=UPI00358ED794